MTRLFLLAALLLPALGIAESRPSLIADFEDQKHGFILGAKPAFAEGNPYGSAGSSLEFKGRKPASLVIELVRGGASASGPRLKVDTLSPTGSLSLAYQGKPGQRFRIRLLNTLPEGGAEAALDIADASWNELRLGFPPQEGAGVFIPFRPMNAPLTHAGAIEIEALDPDFSLRLDDLRFDPPAYVNGVAAVAQAMGTSAARAAEARALGLPERIGWGLMRMAEACRCPPSQVYALRRTMSWGEMAEAQGLSWEGLLADVASRAAAAGLEAQEPSRAQLLKSMRNDAGDRP